jgi:hypothetical protein
MSRVVLPYREMRSDTATAGTVRTVSWSNQDLDHTVHTSQENLIDFFCFWGRRRITEASMLGPVFPRRSSTVNCPGNDLESQKRE